MADRDPAARLHDVGVVVGLDQLPQAHLSRGQRLATALAHVYSSLLFVALELVLLVGWVVLNSAPLGVRHVDPAPFPLLTLALTVEVLVLSTCVLVAQRHAAARDERRTQVMLHLDKVVEEKTSLLLRLLTELHEAQGLPEAEPAARALQDAVDVTKVVEALDAAHTGT